MRGPVILVLLVCSAVAEQASFGCSRPHPGRTANPEGGQLRLMLEGDEGALEPDAVSKALEMWSMVCGDRLPEFSSQGDINVRLRFHRGPNDLEGCGEGCACTIVNTRRLASGGDYVASSITHLFEQHRDGSGHCADHRVETIAHELGHVLGFRHPTDPYSSHCSGLIMSFTPDRIVREVDCEVARAVWGK